MRRLALVLVAVPLLLSAVPAVPGVTDGVASVRAGVPFCFHDGPHPHRPSGFQWDGCPPGL